jgi:hypothetical protein
MRVFVAAGLGSRATATIAHATESRRVTMPLMVT